MRILWLALLLLPSWSRAEETLRVSLIFGPGEMQTEYKLEGPEVRQFWQRWSDLPPTSNMVPLGTPSGYRGLRIRGESKEIRLFNGVGAEEERARLDGQRALERWVLTKAPAPLGPALVAKLDELVDVPGGGAHVTSGPEALAGTIIGQCRSRARFNSQLRARCLVEGLLEHREPDALVPALENALKATEPPEALEAILNTK
jgi:hypothetical protein